MAPMTASILARTIWRAATGAVATSSGASSPEIASQASPPASCPAAMTSTGTSTTTAPPSPTIAAPQQDGGRQQIEDLHQRSATPARGRAAAAAIPSAAARGRGVARRKPVETACRRGGGAETPLAARRTRRSAAQTAAIDTPSRRRLQPSTPASAARSPKAARAGQYRRLPTIGRQRDELGRHQHVGPGQAAEGLDRGELQPDHERGADDRGHDLRDQPRPLRPSVLNSSDGERHRKRHGREAHRHASRHSRRATGMPPSDDQDVDEWRAEQHRHHRDRQRHGRDAHGEQPSARTAGDDRMRSRSERE